MQKNPLFLTTHGLNYYIERLINEAEKYIYIITPYIKVNNRLKELLIERMKSGINIIIICRGDNLVDDVSSFAAEVKNRNNLHAKCYYSDKAAIVTSLNLYEFGQINNDEMGFYCAKSDMLDTYTEISKEVDRIYKSSNFIHNTLSKINNSNLDINKFNWLVIGKKYSLNELDSYFNFDYKKPSGIKETKDRDIVLFMNKSIYNNQEKDGIIYYQGQNTGHGEQKLILGNKLLHDSYNVKSKHIFLFESYVYRGEYYIYDKPYKHEGRWIFPIAKVG